MSRQCVRLETERLVLRPWKEEDYDPFFSMSMDPLVSKFFLPFEDRAACDAFLDEIREDFNRRGWGFWAVEYKETQQFIGMVGMHEPGPKFGVGYPCVEIGWRLVPAFWRKGLVTEAAREILRFAFEDLRLPKVVSFAATKNERSLNVMKRLGMHFEKEFEVPMFPPGHPGRPHFLYALSREEWMERNKV